MFRHHQYHFISHNRSRHRQRDAGVAAGRFDQGIAGLDLAARLRMLDHGQRRTVFHRPCRVIAFQLDQYGVGGIARNALQFYQRGVADIVGKRLIAI